MLNRMLTSYMYISFWLSEARRRESEGHTSASETEGDQRSHAAGVLSPLAKESPVKQQAAAAVEATDSPAISAANVAVEQTKPKEAEKGQGDSETSDRQSNVDRAAAEPIASNAEKPVTPTKATAAQSEAMKTQSSSEPPPKEDTEAHKSELMKTGQDAVVDDSKPEEKSIIASDNSDSTSHSTIISTEGSAKTSPTKQRETTESSHKTRTSVAIAAGKLQESPEPKKRPARPPRDLEAATDEVDKSVEEVKTTDDSTDQKKTSVAMEVDDKSPDTTKTQQEASPAKIEKPVPASEAGGVKDEPQAASDGKSKEDLSTDMQVSSEKPLTAGEEKSTDDSNKRERHEESMEEDAPATDTQKSPKQPGKSRMLNAAISI